MRILLVSYFLHDRNVMKLSHVNFESNRLLKIAIRKIFLHVILQMFIQFFKIKGDFFRK